jgi:hypothetical protein
MVKLPGHVLLTSEHFFQNILILHDGDLWLEILASPVSIRHICSRAYLNILMKLFIGDSQKRPLKYAIGLEPRSNLSLREIRPSKKLDLWLDLSLNQIAPLEPRFRSNWTLGSECIFGSNFTLGSGFYPWSDGRFGIYPWLGLDSWLGMHPWLGMIRDSDGILGSG